MKHGNPNHAKDGKFSSGGVSGGGSAKRAPFSANVSHGSGSAASANASKDQPLPPPTKHNAHHSASGHNAGGGNRPVANHVKEQHKGGVLHMIKNFLFSRPHKGAHGKPVKNTFKKGH